MLDVQYMLTTGAICSMCTAYFIHSTITNSCTCVDSSEMFGFWGVIKSFWDCSQNLKSCHCVWNGRMIKFDFSQCTHAGVMASQISGVTWDSFRTNESNVDWLLVFAGPCVEYQQTYMHNWANTSCELQILIAFPSANGVIQFIHCRMSRSVSLDLSGA